MCVDGLCKAVEMQSVARADGSAIMTVILLLAFVAMVLLFLNEQRKAKDLLASKLKLTHEERSKLRWL